ncbi:MAG: hypothetical protein V1817_04490, partial [Candidatus Micrarchaeota archaeon]
DRRCCKAKSSIETTNETANTTQAEKLKTDVPAPVADAVDVTSNTSTPTSTNGTGTPTTPGTNAAAAAAAAKAKSSSLAWAGALHGAMAGGVVGGALLYAEYARCTLPAWLKGCTDAKTEALIDADAGESDLMITSCLGPNWKVGLSEAPPTQAEEQPPESSAT